MRRGRWIAPTLLFLTYLTMLPVGFLAHAFTASPDRFHDLSGHIDTDLVIPWLLGPEGNVLGPVAGAFFLTVLVAAATFRWFLVKRSFAGGALQNWHEVYVGTAVSLMIYVAVSVVRR